MNEINIYKAPIEEKGILENLLQFYIYDFTEYIDAHLEDNGLFKPYRYLDDYWIEIEHRFPYLVTLDGKYAGFALVRYEEEEKHLSIAEFFVMKKYRRTGLGQKLAKEMFDLHKGEWEITQLMGNVPAQHFWRKVIGEYTNGNYVEKIVDGKVIQHFRS